MNGLAAGLLHTGTISHRRHVAPLHRFSYRIWMISVDIDRIGELNLRLFRHDRAGLVSLQTADHGERDGTKLREWVERHLRQAGLDAFSHQIRFMVIPRVLGFAFNPIAFFFCYNAVGQLGAVLHQVKNTFADQVAYVLPVAPEGGVVRQSSLKQMHVSPFFDMDGGYRFSFRRPDFAPNGQFALSIRYGTRDVARLTATMRLRTEVLTDGSLLRQLLAMPMMPLKVVAAIHWEALKIWLRGARYHQVPARLGKAA